MVISTSLERVWKIQQCITCHFTAIWLFTCGVSDWQKYFNPKNKKIPKELFRSYNYDMWPCSMTLSLHRIWGSTGAVWYINHSPVLQLARGLSHSSTETWSCHKKHLHWWVFLNTSDFCLPNEHGTPWTGREMYPYTDVLGSVIPVSEHAHSSANDRHTEICSSLMAWPPTDKHKKRSGQNPCLKKYKIIKER